MDVTDASVHDSQKFDGLLNKTNTSADVYADSAYRSAETEAKLRVRGLRSQIHQRASRNHPLSKAQENANRKRARFGLASSTCSEHNKPLRVVGSYGRLALLGRKPKSASRTSPTTSAVLSRWSEWPPHDGGTHKRDLDRNKRNRFRGNQHRKRASRHGGEDPTTKSSLFEVPLCLVWRAQDYELGLSPPITPYHPRALLA